MKLRTKTLLYFLILMSLMLTGAGLMTYWGMKNVVREEIEEALFRNWRLLRPILRKSNEPVQMAGAGLEIRSLPEWNREEEYRFRDTLLPEIEERGEHFLPSTGNESSALPHLEPETEFDKWRVLEVRTRINGKAYSITLYQATIDNDDWLETLFWVMGGVFLLFLVGIGSYLLLMERRLWRPFYRALDQIQHYEMTRSDVIPHQASHTREFDRLSRALHDMTIAIQRDYLNMKRFNENAAHELQTPLSVMQSKLDRLLQTGSLDEAQTNLIAGTLDALRRLRRLNAGLILLSKIENRQFSEVVPIKMGTLIQQLLSEQEELIELKTLSLELTPMPPFQVHAHPGLADALIRNLLSNAIRHNHPGGKVSIALHRAGQNLPDTAQTDHSSFDLCISNTGPASPLQEDQLFQRFSKAKGNAPSPGLGLAIAKEICQLYDWEISYRFEAGMHSFKVKF